ncbi:MAG TPA: MFS transporter [Bacillales bacterium]|nr:MFS transporter [Bacillales bacterium]
MSKQTYLIAFSIFILSTGGFTALPLFVEMTKIHGISLVQVGLLTSVYIFSQKFTPLWFGPLGDHFGHKKMACTGELLRGIGFIGLACSNHYLMLLLFATIAGLGGGTAGPSLKSLLMLSVDTAFRPKASALRSTAVNVGMVTGPALAGLVIFIGYINGIFLIAGFCYWLGSGLIFFFTDSVSRVKTGSRPFSFSVYKEIGRNKRFLHLLCLMFLVWMLFAQLFVTIPNYAKDYTPHIEQIFFINGGLGILLEYLIGHFMSETKQPGHFIAFGTILLLLSFFTFGMIHNVIGLYSGIVMFTLGELFIFPSAETMVANLSSGDHNMAAYFGVSSLSDGLGRPAGNFLGALLFSLIPSASICWTIIACVCFILLMYEWFLLKKFFLKGLKKTGSTSGRMNG